MKSRKNLLVHLQKFETTYNFEGLDVKLSVNLIYVVQNTFRQSKEAMVDGKAIKK